MTESTLLNTFYTYLKRRLRFHESMLVVIQHSDDAESIEEHRMLKNQLEDIIHHFEELVKDGMENPE